MKASNVAWVVFIVIVIVGLSLIFWHPRGTVTPTDWLTFTDEANVYTFRYPADFSSEYVTLVDWPPQVNLLEGTGFNCANGKEYCVTVAGEGAAGSTYTKYTYLTKHNGQIMSLIFTTRTPQCLNYDEPKQSACKTDQANFNPDAIIGQIINSFTFNR